jgi:CHAT domain
MSDTADRILREALSGAVGSRKPPDPGDRPRGIRSASPRLDVFLDLELDALTRREQGEWVTELRPGETYRLTVRIGSRPEGGDGPAWRLSGDAMVLSVACPDCPELAITAEAGEEECPNPSAVLLTRRQIEEGSEVDFRIEVPVTCPRCRGGLEVSCAATTNRFPEVCRYLPVEVQGEHIAWTDEGNRTWNLDPASPVPGHVAFLYVQERHRGRLTLQGWSRRQDLEDLEMDRPELSLASFVEDQHAADEIVGRVTAFSAQRIPGLQAWLRDLLTHHGEALLLVIVDPTGAEIPWEMIRLGNGGYLGARAEVVRWAQLWEFDERIGLRLEPRDCSGSALCFLDTGSPGGIETEREELGRLGAERLGSPREILERLSCSAARVGLLYMACHGAIAYPEREARRYHALYSETDPGRRIVDLDLELLVRQAVRIPAVFVNACHSGRLLGDGEGIFGLPAVFLRKVADGYIGTLGAVNDAQAAAIGTRILRAFRESTGGIRPSELLRRLRSEAAETLDLRRSGRESSLRFLFTFMYVYYGNPLDRLTLRCGDSPGAEEEP